MNEQEKVLQGIVEFCQWLIPNAKQLGLEQSKSIAMISQAQTPDDIMNGMNSLYQELGEERFTALTQAFQKSKSQNIKMAKKGTKINYLVNKFNEGDKIQTHYDGEKVAQSNLFDKLKMLLNKWQNINVQERKLDDNTLIGRRISNYGTPNADTTWYYNSGDLSSKVFRVGDQITGTRVIMGVPSWINENEARDFKKYINKELDKK